VAFSLFTTLPEMPVVLSERQPDLTEIMDRKDCDPLLLENTYRQFETINLLLSGWKNIYRKEIKPMLKEGESYSLLDIGFGGGDVPTKLAKWAQADGFDLTITAIEMDVRALKFANQYRDGSPVNFKFMSSSSILDQGLKFDFVISNHLLHHLNAVQTESILHEAEQLATTKVIFSDIRRSDLGYLLFSTFTPLLFRNSFIVKDGLTSIKRSYIASELRAVIPSAWIVKKKFPFRLLLIHEK
jgi:2-polyprenyl-3-methyl-5-hydroxy-6-metoxy-1,4-benzoquinol methylase